MRTHADFKRGAFIALVFAIVLFGLIPVYVQRPTFIPGFAPPPDMWPRVVAGTGLAMGILEMLIALFERKSIKTAPVAMNIWWKNHADHVWRFAQAAATFMIFILMIPLVGFLIASILLGSACLILAGGWAHRGWMVGLAIGLPLTLYFLFATFINTPFPKGSLIRALGLG